MVGLNAVEDFSQHQKPHVIQDCSGQYWCLTFIAHVGQSHLLLLGLLGVQQKDLRKGYIASIF